MPLRYAFNIIVLHIIKIPRCSMCQRDTTLSRFITMKL